jgi:hypothetical protein
VKWDNGSVNWYFLGNQPDLVECLSKDTKPILKRRLTPLEWFELLLNDIFVCQFDKDFANAASMDGERIFEWLDNMLKPVDALNLPQTTLNSLIRARLFVHACFSHGLLNRAAFMQGSSAGFRILLSIGEACSSNQFCEFLMKKIEDVAASNSLVDLFLAKVWASSFDAVALNNGANATVLCRLLGVFLESTLIPRRVNYGEICDDGEDLNARQGSCLHCNLPWTYHNVHECKVGWSKGSSGEWLKNSSVYPSISASAGLIDKISTSPRCSLKHHLMTQDLSEHCILNDASAAAGSDGASQSVQVPYIRLVLKSNVLPTGFKLVVDSSEMDFVPKTMCISSATSEALLATASSFTINVSELLPLSDQSTPESCMRIIDLSHITSTFTRGCTIQVTVTHTHAASSSLGPVKIFGIVLSENEDILVRVASLALASASLASSQSPTASLTSSASADTTSRLLQTGLKWLQLLYEPADAMTKIGKHNPSTDNINRSGRAMSGSDSDPDSRFCGRSFADGSTCSSNSSQCPDCMAGAIVIQNPSIRSESSLFASKMLSPALEIAIMNLLVVESGDEPSKGTKSLYIPRDVECSPLLSDLLYSHMLRPQYVPSFRSALAAAASSSTGPNLHPAIAQAVREIIICHSQQSAYADSPESATPTSFFAALIEAVDDVIYALACQRLAGLDRDKRVLGIDVVIQCVQEAVASVFGSFQHVYSNAPVIHAASPTGASHQTQGTPVPVFSEDLYQILEGMGFPRAACHLALKHAEGDPERASEWIVLNIDDLDDLIHADALKNCDATPDSTLLSSPSSPSPMSLPPAVAAASTASASRLLARLSAELTIFARALPWGSPLCDQFFTILGQGISSDSAQAAFIAGLKLGDEAAAEGTDADGKAASGLIYRMIPSLIPSFIDATRQIRSHPVYGSFKKDPLASSLTKTPFPKPKPKPPKPSDLERSMIEMGFPASKVQLAMRRNPGLTDRADQRHLDGLMEALFALDDDDVELRALEEEQLAAAMSTSSAASAAPSSADDAAANALTTASDPVMMKFFGLSAALRYSLNSQGIWDKSGRVDVGMVQAVVASLAPLGSPVSLATNLTLLLKYRQLITSTCKSIIPSTQSQTFESEHPYAHNLNIDFPVSFPGARCIDIVFDPKCRTESSCDYLRFWQGSQQVGQDKYHGGSSGWPSLKLQGDSFRVTFFSDGSQNDWGYKFTATATCPPVAHWADFEKTAAVLLPLIDASVAQLFTQGSSFHVPSDLLPLLDGPWDAVLPSCRASSAKGGDASLKDCDEGHELRWSILNEDCDEEGSGSDADEGVEEVFEVSDSHTDCDSDHLHEEGIMASEPSPQPDAEPRSVDECSKRIETAVASDIDDSESSTLFTNVAEVCFLIYNFFHFIFTKPSSIQVFLSLLCHPSPSVTRARSCLISCIIDSCVNRKHDSLPSSFCHSHTIYNAYLEVSLYTCTVSTLSTRHLKVLQLTLSRDADPPPVQLRDQELCCVVF